MATYTVERVDVSSCTVEANSPEEAIEISNNDPELWDIAIGETEAILEN